MMLVIINGAAEIFREASSDTAPFYDLRLGSDLIFHIYRGGWGSFD
jgi:hypothetical protein